jgi:hypothetical protein
MSNALAFAVEFPLILVISSCLSLCHLCFDSASNINVSNMMNETRLFPNPGL